jgi:hypothetical protein
MIKPSVTRAGKILLSTVNVNKEELSPVIS